MSVLIASLLLVVVSTAYGGILHMGPPMGQPFPQQLGRFQNQFQSGSMIYPEMRHVPMQNFQQQMGKFHHYKPFAPSRSPMWNMHQFPAFRHFKQPFQNGNFMGRIEFPVGGMGQGQFPEGGMGQGQFPEGGMGQGQFPVGDMGQDKFPVGDMDHSHFPLGGMGQGQLNNGYYEQGQWNGNIGGGQWNDMPQGQGQWDQQNFGTGDQWQNSNMQQGSFNGQGSAGGVQDSVFASEVVKDNPGGSVTMIGNWRNEGGAGTGQGIKNQGFPNDLYAGNDGFISNNQISNNNQAYTVNNGNSNPSTGLVQKSNDAPVQSNNLKKKKK